MQRALRHSVFPLLDPPGSDETHFIRSLTRNRTPWDGPNEYVLSSTDGDAAIEALVEGPYHRHEFWTTVKFVDDDGIVVEAVSLASGAWERSGGETMQHAYAFPAADGGLHWHHHREWPVAHPRHHQHGSRTHGDPDGVLTSTLEDVGVDFEAVERPQYA